MKKAIVVGHTGQDGTYLSTVLREKNYEVVGIASRQVTKNKYGIEAVDIRNILGVENLLQAIVPDEIYYLAGVHRSSADMKIEEGELFQKSVDLHVKALINFLEGIRKFSLPSKLFYAGSPHIYGSSLLSPQNELTLLRPDCIYGITKTAGIRACHFYKNNHSIFASVGILYNRESPLRESKHISKKIVETAVAIHKGLANELVLGSLESQIDWGYTPDYMQAVYQIMQLNKPDDFIVSSGATHTIRDFVSGVFTYLGLKWTEVVRVDPSLVTKKRKQNVFGDNRKIRKAGWTPRVNFKGLIKILVDEELKKYDPIRKDDLYIRI